MSENNFTSMKSTEGGFKNMKFRVSSPEQSEALQMKLFEMGYSWVASGINIKYTDAEAIFTEDTGSLTHDNLFVFKASPYTEMNTEEFINSGQPVKETGMTLREQLQQKVIAAWEKKVSDAADNGDDHLDFTGYVPLFVVSHFRDAGLTWTETLGSKNSTLWWK